MSNFARVTIPEFLWLLTQTQKEHIENGEPIPAINEVGLGQISYCLEAPFMGIGDQDFYETFDHKAAILFYDICKMHCLLNGNKRMAVETTIYFAWKDGRYSYMNKNLLIDVAKRVVESRADDKDEIVWWVSRVFYGGIRVMTTWMKIRVTMRVLPRAIFYIVKILVKRTFRTKTKKSE